MKKSKIVIMLIICLIMMILTSCDENKYCSVYGCPKYHIKNFSYCFEHKCGNIDCGHKAVSSYGYCTECLNH